MNTDVSLLTGLDLSVSGWPYNLVFRVSAQEGTKGLPLFNARLLSPEMGSDGHNY